MAGYCGELQYAQFEREILRERTRAGLAHAPERQTAGATGNRGGRRCAIRKLHRAGFRKSQIARRLKVGRTSVRRILARSFQAGKRQSERSGVVPEIANPLRRSDTVAVGCGEFGKPPPQTIRESDSSRPVGAEWWRGSDLTEAAGSLRAPTCHPVNRSCG
jgi:helix-turn-helix resolvase-like protein